MTFSAKNASVPSLHERFEGKNVPPRVQERWDRLTPADRTLLGERVLAPCRFTVSELLRLFEGLADTVRAERISLADLLNDPTLNKILTAEDLSAKQKAERVIGFLETRRFPIRARAESEWKAGLDALDRPREIWIPLVSALECADLKKAVECPAGSREKAHAWVDAHAEALKQLLDRCRRIDR